MESKEAAPQSMEDQISASLEKQKMRLFAQIKRDEKTKAELEARIEDATAKILNAKRRLGEYNALFMTLDNAAAKAPAQRLGANAAVMGTKRIVERELHKALKESALAETKLNKQKERNTGMRGQVDALRKEHVTFKKLFVAMTDELGAARARIAATRRAIDEAYATRDHAQESMRELVRLFELDKLERAAEWALFTEAIEKANKEGVAGGGD